ncbi:MAG: hypothetical protein [Caudoviricetes sp.]|nr:MAG: hypothetical protein [Caudoviricetes sp.]
MTITEKYRGVVIDVANENNGFTYSVFLSRGQDAISRKTKFATAEKAMHAAEDEIDEVISRDEDFYTTPHEYFYDWPLYMNDYD